MNPPAKILLLAALLLAPARARGAVPEAAPRLSAATRAVLAGGIDSLGRAHLAAGRGANTDTDAPASAVLEPLSRVPVNVPQAALDAHLRGTVSLRVRVARTGLVDSVIVLAGDSRLRAAAAASVRWWIFAPPARRTWTSLHVDVDGSAGADPLQPDLLALAADAERRGAPWEAIDDCVGALHRLGTHPSVLDEWSLRARVIQDAKRSAGRLRTPGALMSPCLAARGQQLRTMGRDEHAAYVATFDRLLLVSPWWADGYQWRAASLLLCGRGLDAVRSIALFRLAAPDSAARSLADRAQARLASGDSLGTSQLLMREGLQVNRDEDADH